MPLLPRLSSLWRNLFRKDRAEQELKEEVDAYLEMLIETRIKQGINLEEARRQSLLELGGVEQVKERVREVRIGHHLETLWRDLRYGLRMLRRSPGFTLVAVITLALGIGVNTALFTVFDAVVLKPLPLKDPESIVRIRSHTRDGRSRWRFSYLDYLDYRDRNQAFEGLVAWSKISVALGEKSAVSDDDLSVLFGESEYIFGQIVSGNYFGVLGAGMALGRGIAPEEDRTPGAHPVIVLSYSFWQRRFQADPNIVGHTIKLAGEPFTVIGVTAREFIGTEPDSPQFWIPLMMRDRIIQARGGNDPRWLTDRQADSVELVGRLRPGLRREQAAAELSVIAEQLAQQFPELNRGTGIELVRAATFIQIEVGLPLITPLFLAVGLILLMACANVANLLLARAATRQKEMTVRLALGASRWRVIRQLLTESVLLSALGSIAGLSLAVWALSVLYPVVMSRLPLPKHLAESFALNLDPDYRIFAFTLLAALVAGIAAGLAPALQASRPNLSAALKDEGSTFGAHLSQSRLRNALVVTQIAVCLSLLIGAGLLMRNLQKVRTVDTGMETGQVGAILTGLQTLQKEPARESALRHQLVERLKNLLGVKSVSQADWQPLAGRGKATPITIPGHEPPEGRQWRATFNFVSADYFETLGIRLTRGRIFTDQEVQSNRPVVVVSEATARRFWPNEDAIGKRLGIGAAAMQPEGSAKTSETTENFPQFEVIGIARDTRSGWVWEQDETFLYVPLSAAFENRSRTGEYVLIRAEGDPNKLTGAVRNEAAAVDPDLRVVLRRVNDSLAYQMAPFRVVASLAGVLGMLALLLASVGLYGVMSFIVTQRRREIGIRAALGAQGSEVVSLFLRQGMKLIVLGVMLGLAGGVVISHLLAAVLVDLNPLDPLAFAGVTVILTVIALLACYIPARRATRVDPMIALREE